uniref:Uncharacterized protein n=1 Tax=Panagrolaimus sp. ES5 TaxID=591445 RepID=A0AC34FKY2_9BILA
MRFISVQSTPRAVTSNEACQPKANPELEKLNKENSDLKAQLQVVNEKVEALEAQLAEAKLPNPELEQLREEQNDLKARLQTATKYEKQVEVLKAQLENYYEIDKNLAEANQLVKVLQDENKNLQNRELKVSAELKKANDETVEHKKERDEMKKTVETLIVEKEELNKLVDINEKKVADFTDYYNETSPRIRELQNTMNSMELEKK